MSIFSTGPDDFATAENTILEKQTLAPRITRYLVFNPQLSRKVLPGQFVILKLSAEGERIPLTVVDTNVNTGSITLIVQTVGKSTALLESFSVGQAIPDLVGPLGLPSEIKQFGHVVVVGGGVGAAVAYPVARAMKVAGNRVTTIIGARSEEFIILKSEFDKISDHAIYTTDDGSYGRHGFVTDALKGMIDEGQTIDRVLAIGPLPMMRAISELTRPYKIPTIVSLNTIMVDGTGMCGGCRVTVGDKVRFTCVDGPEFDGHLVDFPGLVQRNRTYDHEGRCRLDAPLPVEGYRRAQVSEPDPGPQKMPELAVEYRKQNFEEVALGFSVEQAQAEAKRCLGCRNAQCVKACPVSVNIPGFIAQILSGDFATAGRMIKEDNALPRVCGRVCPQSEQCQGACVLNKRGTPVAIGALERFASDYLATQPEVEPVVCPSPKKAKVAMVGSGPAGLSCAGALAQKGVQVSVFEAFHDFGGVLRYGIPEFRLPKAIVSQEVEALKQLGVRFVANNLIGSTLTIADLLGQEGFHAVFIGTGAGLPNFLNIPGESLVGVYSANEFLTRVNLMKAWNYPNVDTPLLDLRGKTVAVFGGGNTALDSARVAIRLSAGRVLIIYRRSEAEMPGRVEEIEHARAEGVEFMYLHNPLAFVGDEGGLLQAVRLNEMTLGAVDSSGRRRPVPVEGSDIRLALDVAVVAIGNGSNPILARNTPDLAVDRWGHIVADENSLQTSIPGVYAGGDIVTGGATVIKAMGAGRQAAQAILENLEEAGLLD